MDEPIGKSRTRVDFAVVTNWKNLSVGPEWAGLTSDQRALIDIERAPSETSSREMVAAFARERIDQLLAVFEAAKGAGESPDVTPSTEGAFADLTGLMACTALGDGFVALAGALWVSCRKAGGRPPVGQLDACLSALRVLRQDDNITTEFAFARIAAMRAAGLDPDIHAFNKLAEVDRGGDDVDADC